MLAKSASGSSEAVDPGGAQLVRWLGERVRLSSATQREFMRRMYDTRCSVYATMPWPPVAFFGTPSYLKSPVMGELSCVLVSASPCRTRFLFKNRVTQERLGKTAGHRCKRPDQTQARPGRGCRSASARP